MDDRITLVDINRIPIRISVLNTGTDMQQMCRIPHERYAGYTQGRIERIVALNSCRTKQ